LSGLILFGEQSLLKTLKEYMAHYHQERNHQGKDNRLLFPSNGQKSKNQKGKIRCRSQFGGMLKYYHKEAA
jgi:putative transposase